MKFFVILVLALVAYNVSPAEIKKRPVRIDPVIQEKIKGVVAHCVKETNTTPELWQMVLDQKYEDSERFRDYMYCMSINMGLHSEDGTPLLDMFFEFLFKDDDIRKVLTTCKETLEGERPKDMTYNFFRCYQKFTPVYMTFD